jgi:enoyl-CoA hydratase
VTDVLVRREGRLGRLTLDRPASLNALTLGMVRTIDAALTAWDHDDAIAAVLIDGEGERAFCAGGDIRTLYDAARGGAWAEARTYFFEEYRLNARLGRYPKPVVSVMHGLAMGGGIGLGAHVAFRIVTETSRLALPECGIGFSPDVGGTFRLGRAPGETGLHAALTGARLDPADAIACGFADRLVPSEQLGALRDGLSGCRGRDEVAALIEALAVAPAASRLVAARDWIDNAYAHETAEAILAALTSSSEGESREAATTIDRNSPGSVKIALRAVREARRTPTLTACLEREFRVTLSRIRDPDFIEGIRAAVVDKDRTPRWQPARLADVTEVEVARHFVAPEGEAGLGLSA